MADYISALTGQEMDAALQDMAEHNSEAWAVGTRNGILVQQGDETFENNSKYWAGQAANYIQGTITEAVRWDMQQSLNASQKAQARGNIGAAANDSPALTGTPTAPTPAAGDDSTKVATTEFVNDAIDAADINGQISARINRTTNVNAADANYTTLMARGSSLVDTETTPSVNGAICWFYE